MALTPLHVKDVCYGQAGKSNTWNPGCKYLTYEFVDKKSVPLCMKKAPAIFERKKSIDQLYGGPKNDAPGNCSGYRWLKYVEQGYDIHGSS